MIVNKLSLLKLEVSQIVSRSITNQDRLKFIRFLQEVNSHSFISEVNIADINEKANTSDNNDYVTLDYISKLVADITSIHMDGLNVIDIILKYVTDYVDNVRTLYGENSNILINTNMFNGLKDNNIILILFFINLTYEKKLKIYKENNDKH